MSHPSTAEDFYTYVVHKEGFVHTFETLEADSLICKQHIEWCRDYRQEAPDVEKSILDEQIFFILMSQRLLLRKMLAMKQELNK